MQANRFIQAVLIGAALALPVPAARAEDNAVIKGKIVFKGDPAKYRRTVLDTTKDPQCKKMKAKIGSYNVILNSRTDPVTIRNVMVWIESGLEGRTFPGPSEPAVLDQKGCEYTPHVLGMMEGQELIIRNSDDTNHNIHFLPKVNEEFNKTQPKKGMEDTIKLSAEEPFRVKCDVHPWMGSYIGVFKHPFFAVTEAEGTYELKGLPPGKYVVKAWHEEFGEKTQEVQIGSGETREVDLTYEP